MPIDPLQGVSALTMTGSGLEAPAVRQPVAGRSTALAGACSEAGRAGEAGLQTDDTVEAQARRRSQMAFLAVYIETCGAPEEKEEDRVKEPPEKGDRNEDEDEKVRKRALPATILETRGQVEQDPDDAGSVTVYAVRIDAAGKAHYSRAMEFDATNRHDEDPSAGRDAGEPGRAEYGAEKDVHPQA